VWLPPSDIGLSLDNVSSVAPDRGPSSVSTLMSPFFEDTVTGAISSPSRPSSIACTAS